ncbi:hypothetical protein REPUB_Repub09cG0183100 [Reevesia pubescens]
MGSSLAMFLQLEALWLHKDGERLYLIRAESWSSVDALSDVMKNIADVGLKAWPLHGLLFNIGLKVGVPSLPIEDSDEKCPCIRRDAEVEGGSGYN